MLLLALAMRGGFDLPAVSTDADDLELESDRVIDPLLFVYLPGGICFGGFVLPTREVLDDGLRACVGVRAGVFPGVYIL